MLHPWLWLGWDSDLRKPVQGPLLLSTRLMVWDAGWGPGEPRCSGIYLPAEGLLAPGRIAKDGGL